MTYNYGGLKVTLRVSYTIYVSLVNMTTECAALNKHRVEVDPMS